MRISKFRVVQILLLSLLSGLAACSSQPAIPPTGTGQPSPTSPPPAITEGSGSAAPTAGPVTGGDVQVATGTPAESMLEITTEATTGQGAGTALPVAGSATSSAPSKTGAPGTAATSRPAPTVQVPTEQPLPTPQPIAGVLTDFPPDVNPLTGEKEASADVLNHIPLLIKVSNSPSIVRPQNGLSAADMVFEHYAEGGVTRFTALFWDQLPRLVGSNRSMRLIDLELPAIYHAFFAYSGSSAGVHQKLLASDYYAQRRVISPELGQGAPIFNRIPNGKAYEHTLFVDPRAMRNEAIRRGLDRKPDLRGMGFSSTLPAGGSPASQVTVGYTANNVLWKYSAGSGRYLRWDDGVAQTDANNGQQLSAANVAVLYVNQVTTLILEDVAGAGHYSIEIQLWGSGPMKLFRNGQVFNGTWHRPQRNGMLTFTGADGQLLPFQVGNTWFQVVPLNFGGLRVQ